MRFWAGLAVGFLLGAITIWVALEKPWRKGSSAPVVAAAADAAPAATAPVKRKRRGRHGARGGEDEGGEELAEAPPPVLTAADRQMAWRGASITLPGGDVDLGSDSDARPLERDEIDSTMNASAGPILDCIQGAVAGAELGGGKVVLEMLVDGGGGVRKVRVGAPRWLIEHGLADCASSAARRIRFPATGAYTRVEAPFHLD